MAITNKGLSWLDTSESMKENKELLLLAIAQNGNLLFLLSQNNAYFEKFHDIINDATNHTCYVPKLGGECAVCLDTKQDIIALLCFESHNVCRLCLQQLIHCPLCRKPIQKKS